MYIYYINEHLFFMHLMYVNSTETQCVPFCFFMRQAAICHNT